MPIRVEYHVVVIPDLDVVPGGGWDVRGFRKPGLIQPFRRLDNLVQSRRHLRRRDAATENIPSGHGGPVEIAVRVLALDKRRTLERQPREQTLKAQISIRSFIRAGQPFTL